MILKSFEKVYTQGAVNVTEIWVDKDTGVNYLYHVSGYSGGLTPILDRDGKPVISPVANDNNHEVQLLVDEDLKTSEFLGCHPCVFTSSLKIKTNDIFEKFLPAVGHEPQTVHLVGED